MTHVTAATRQASDNQPLEVFLQIGLAALLVFGCLLILRPFVLLIMWGSIIAIVSYPTFLKLEKAMRWRRVWVATLWTILLLLVLIAPLVLLTQSLVEGAKPIVTKLLEGNQILPPPPASVAQWPIIGPPVARFWGKASSDLSDTLMKFSPQIKSALPGILSAFANLGVAVVQFLLSILLAGVLLANAEAGSQATSLLCDRLFGERGAEFQQLIGTTIHSVTFGVLGVAVIQSAFAAVGFLVAGLPAAGLWCAAFLLAAVLQAGGITLVPAIIYMFAVASPTKAVIFLIWCIFVGLMDNVLKPILLGRGVSVPIIVVFLGVLGGFLAIGGVGLFVGPIVLSVGYKLFQAWVQGGPVWKAEG